MEPCEGFRVRPSNKQDVSMSFNIVSPLVQATVISSVAYFNVPKGPVLQAGQVATLSGMAAGGSAAINTFFNQAWTVLRTGPFVISIGGVNQLWEGFAATSKAPALGPFTLSAAGNAAAGNTTYTGTITGYDASLLVGQPVTIAGFVINSGNNGTFTIVSGSPTTLVVNNAAGVSESQASTATLGLVAALPVQSEYTTVTQSNVNITVNAGINTTTNVMP